MKNALHRILFSSAYFLFWIVYFVFARLFFLVYYFENTKEIGFLNSLKTFFYGFQLDISFAGYLAVVPFLLIVCSVVFSPQIISKIIKIYTFIILIIINLLLISDAGLYVAWGTRLDATLLKYLNTPKVMLASISGIHFFLGILFWVVASLLFMLLYNKQVQKRANEVLIGNTIQIPVFLVLAGILILPIRGGFQTIPINESSVYFSDKMFANHAAINFSWNFINAITKKSDGKNPYVFFDHNEAQKIIDSTRNPILYVFKDSILNTPKPNILLIIWESLPAKLVGTLGGESNVTPNLNKLSKEGILFTNFYGNGDRTDKGIPAILSGYYPQPQHSIMKMPVKSRSLPFLSKKLIDLGYATSFYYGGDLNFGNMNTYLRNGAITNFVDGNGFDTKNWNSKWGVHDHVFMERFADDLTTNHKEPFFKIALTLSSHEPFELPTTYKFGNETELNKFRSSHAYTDEVIGKFISYAKQQTWWKNTLIILMADHGSRMPKHEGAYNGPKKFQIPMLWLGGALAKTNIEIDHFSSQIDFPYTLLKLLKADTSDFTFGKNIFNASENQYAQYMFNNGFGILDKNGTFVYDFTGGKIIISEGTSARKLDSLGKAISQNAYQDFLDRK